MINANQITSRLRMMSDQDLQRFAEMHKQDPYMFPLAFNESNMRKEMRSAPQGQGAAPQAPVNQQALAAMQPAQLPEDQGIGALNPNMQFADGGLVSFAGGGESTAGPYSRADDRDFGTGGVAYADGGAIRFAEGEEVPSPRYGRGLIPNAPYRMAPYGGYDYSPEAVAERKAKREQEEKARQSTPETLEDVQTRQGVLEAGLPFVAGAADVGTLVPRLLRKGYDVGAKYINAFGGNLPREGAESARYRNEMFPNLNAALAQDAQQAKQPKPAAAEAKAAVDEAARLKAAPPAPAPAPDTTPRAPRATPSAAASPKGITAIADQFDPTAATKKLYEDAAAEQAKRDAEREKEYQANRPETESFKERRAALEEGRQDVDKQQRMNEGLAWLSFASRVVQPGKTAIQAIVEGASVGAEQYNKAQGELKRAEKERKLGLAALAESERAAERGEKEKAQARMDAANNRFDAVRIHQTDALSKSMDVKTKIAADILQTQMNNQGALERQQLSNQGAMAVAGVRASAGGYGEGAQQAKAEQKLEEAWTKLVTTPGSLQMFKAQYPNFDGTREGFMRTLGYGSTGSANDLSGFSRVKP